MDLSNLFRWTGKVTIKKADGEEVLINGKPLTLHQRIIGDNDRTIARKKALSASRVLRAKLRDEASDEFVVLLPDFEELTAEEVVNLILTFQQLDIRTQARETFIPPRKAVEPDPDASLEAFEEYEEDKESYDAKYEEALSKRAKEITEAEKERLSKLELKALQDILRRELIDQLCRTEMMRVFTEWSVYFGTYEDSKFQKRAFDSFEEFRDCASQLKVQLIEAYNELEVSGEELKKSP